MKFETKRMVGRFGFAVVIALLVTISALYIYNIIKWADYPDFGFGFRSATGIKIVGVVTKNGKKAGMQIGDRILSVNGKEFTKIEDFRAAMQRELGDLNTYQLERNGQKFEVTIENIPIGFKKSFNRTGLSFLVGICYVFIGILVFMMKPHQRTSWIFFLFTSIFGLLLTFFYRLGPTVPIWLENFNIIAYCFTPAVFIHLALSFPEERKLLQKYPYLQLIPHGISFILFLLIRLATPVMTFAPKPLVIFTVIYMACGVLFFLISCLQLRLTSLSQMVKLRSRMMLLGFGIAASLPILDYVANAFFQVYILPSFNFYLPFFVVFPAFVGVSIVKHDLFDIDAIIKRTYGYVLTTGALGGIYGLVVLISNLAFGRYEITKSPIFPLAFILAVVFLFNPVRNRVQKFIDTVFYRLEYDYQETVGKISETMRSLLNLDEIGKSIMHFALQPMFVDAGSVMLLNPDKKTYEYLIHVGQREDRKVGAGAEAADAAEELEEKEVQVPDEAEARDLQIAEFTLPADDALMQKIAEKKKEVTIYDIQEDPFFENERESCEKAFDRLGATLLVPLIYEDQLTGVISLGRKKSGKFYRREDINLLNTLANQGAVAIENARMVEGVIEKERMEEELNIARDLQVSMLPSECPQIMGFEIAAYSVSAREVGGDFYDFIDMGSDKAGMVIGDVTGKSVSGALVMSASRSVFRMLSEDELTVGESMTRANRRLKKDIKSGMFVALLFAVLNSQDRTMTLCSAGQTQPVLLSAKKAEASLVETRGDTFPLGILDDAEYEETQLKLEPGDKVVLYTDGIVEAMNKQEEMFGFERLLELVKNSQTQTTASLLEEIKSNVNEFAGSAPQHDDITIIVVQATE